VFLLGRGFRPRYTEQHHTVGDPTGQSAA